ncbi:MAG: cytochrome c peroxidase [Granulosicoccus sp.]
MKAVTHLLPALLFMSAAAGIAVADTPPPATGYGQLPYELPAVGSYQLPPLGIARDGDLLDADGKQTSLYEVFGDQYILLSFIYSSCSDVNGCPLTSYVSYQIKAEMQDNSSLADKLKLVSVSFDPEYDTPPVMKLYADNFKYAGDAGEWQFFTTESIASLAPILSDYGQDIQRQYSLDGKRTDDFSHILRVFLIDPEKQIRNIYSVGFLHKDVILNDVNSLMLQGKSELLESDNTKGEQFLAKTNQLFSPGDNKTGYESEAYVTQSKNLQSRQGQAADLLGLIKVPPLGLPAINRDGRRTFTNKMIQLGKRLFFDRRLSLNETFSCAMCHIPEQGFTSNELSTAVGVEGRSVRRNSPTIYNIAYAQRLFHDARENTLEQQVWGPLLARNEMANPSVGHVIDKIESLGAYDGLFESAFDGKKPGMETIGEALAAYQTSLLSANSPFDRWYYGKEASALDDVQKSGFDLFTGKAGCVACHHIGEQTALFSDNRLHNTGHGYEASMGLANGTQSVQLAPGIFVDVEQSVIREVSEPKPADLGRYEITQNPDDRWKYKTPTLRNIQLTAPYMHDGGLGSLEQVVRFYNKGGIANSLLSPLIQPLGLNDQEIESLVAFLHALTGDNVELLIADAFAAPIGDRSE